MKTQKQSEKRLEKSEDSLAKSLEKIEKSLIRNVSDFANACNAVAEKPTVAGWERVGYLAECCQGDCAALDCATEAQEWYAIVAWAYRHADAEMRRKLNGNPVLLRLPE